MPSSCPLRLSAMLLSASIMLPTSAPAAAEETVAQLLPILSSRHAASRARALGSLARLGGRAADAVDAVLPLLGDPQPEVRAAAAEALGRFHRVREKVWPALVGALQDEEAVVRASVVEALSRLRSKPEETVAAIHPLAADPDSNVQAAVARALHLVRSIRKPEEHEQVARQVAAALLQLLRHERMLVRSAAARSLTAMPFDKEEIARALITAARDPDRRVRREAVTALGSYAAHDAAVECLAAALDDQRHMVRQRAAEALRGAPRERAISILAKALSAGDAGVREAAAHGLGRFGADPAAIELLAKATADRAADVRYRAILSLARLRSRAAPAVPYLTQRLADPHCMIRLAAADALAGIGPPARAALATLAQLQAEDWHQGVQESAGRAVKAILVPPSQ